MKLFLVILVDIASLHLLIFNIAFCLCFCDEVCCKHILCLSFFIFWSDNII